MRKIIVFLSMFFFLVAETWAQTNCKPIPNSKKCIDQTPCKTDSSGVQVCLAGTPLPAGAIAVTETCWQYSFDYACEDKSIDTCEKYAKNPACSVIGSKCDDTVPDTGKCSTWNFTYQCQTAPAQTSQQTVCTNGVFDSSSMTNPDNKNNTFALAAISQEILRQAATYTKNGQNIFTGVSEACTKGYAGIKNCCKTHPGAKSNSVVSSLVVNAGFSVVKYVGMEAINYLSDWVYDTAYAIDSFLGGMLSDFGLLGEQGPVTPNDFSLGAYGFTYSTGTFEAGSGLMGANTSLVEFQGGGFIQFNPYVFAAVVAFQILQSLASCSDAEMLLAMHKGANLSVFFKEECDKSFLGSCLLYKDSYCSFNSVLAKIVNIQGKSQIGLDPSNCEGLTVDQLKKIDFKKIDFSEFTQQVTNKAISNMPSTADMNSNYKTPMQNKKGGSSQTGTNTVIPTYPKK